MHLPARPSTSIPVQCTKCTLQVNISTSASATVVLFAFGSVGGNCIYGKLGASSYSAISRTSSHLLCTDAGAAAYRSVVVAACTYHLSYP